MRVPNCNTVCREIEEADQGENLTALVTEHLSGCGQCQGFYDERLKLRQLIASLETVVAPADFDLRVRSRLANERSDSRTGSLFNFTFGFPSVAFATLALVIGGVFALRVWNAPATGTTAVKTEKPEASNLSSADGQPPPTESGLIPNIEKRISAAADEDSSETIRNVKRKKINSSRNEVATSRIGRRLTTREFSSTAAPVIRREEAVASLGSPVFLIETSSQPLRLSLDYSGGVSRTISVPALSFGSEKVLSQDGLSLVKNSSKGAW